MIHTLKNNALTVKVSSLGAELVSVVSNEDGCEYMWQGDEAHWHGQAPWLFPVCSSFWEKRYTYRGKTYEMGLHGFARRMEFEPVEATDTTLALRLTSNEETKKQYPLDFSFTIRYRLSGSELFIDLDTENTGNETLLCAPGGHPGFNVPLGGEGDYEDYCLQFDKVCDPSQFLFGEHLFFSGHKSALVLRDGDKFDLRHDLFVPDGIFMDCTSGRVTLRSDKARHFVTVTYPEFPYLGVWATPEEDTAFVCIEPWRGLPSWDGVADDLETRHDMLRIAPGTSRRLSLSYLFG